MFCTLGKPNINSHGEGCVLVMQSSRELWVCVHTPTALNLLEGGKKKSYLGQTQFYILHHSCGWAFVMICLVFSWQSLYVRQQAITEICGVRLKASFLVKQCYINQSSLLVKSSNNIKKIAFKMFVLYAVCRTK